MKKFLIYLSERYSIAISKPLEEEIKKRGFKVKWFCDSKDTKRYLTDIELLDSIDEVFSYDPDIVLTSTNIVPDFFPGIKVQIFHGFSVGKRDEKRGHFNIRGFFDLYCTQGPSTTLPFIKLQKKHKYFDVVETGWSKVDPLFPLTKKRESEEKPTVMITSTFTTRLSLAKNDEVVKELERLSKSGKFNVISVLHPKMESEVIEKFKFLENENFKFYDTTDLVPLYKKADVMLSDTTSAIVEFILQKRPVVTINNNSPKEYMIDIESADKIEESLELALEYPKEIMQSIEEFIKLTHPYDDGNSSKRVIDASLEFLEKGDIRRKPLNLIRRYKIRKKLGYFKF